MKYNLIRITEGQETILEIDTDLQYLGKEQASLIDEADNSMNLFRITVDPEEIEIAMSLMPAKNGRPFAGNWDQDFGQFVTSGPDWEEEIPEDAQGYEEAKQYSEEVRESAARCIELEGECVQALRRGAWSTALEAAEAAYREELQWGDAPSYGPLLRFLRDDERPIGVK